MSGAVAASSGAGDRFRALDPRRRREQRHGNVDEHGLDRRAPPAFPVAGAACGLSSLFEQRLEAGVERSLELGLHPGLDDRLDTGSARRSARSRGRFRCRISAAAHRSAAGSVSRTARSRSSRDCFRFPPGMTSLSSENQSASRSRMNRDRSAIAPSNHELAASHAIAASSPSLAGDLRAAFLQVAEHRVVERGPRLFRRRPQPQARRACPADRRIRSAGPSNGRALHCRPRRAARSRRRDPLRRNRRRRSDSSTGETSAGSSLSVWSSSGSSPGAVGSDTGASAGERQCMILRRAMHSHRHLERALSLDLAPELADRPNGGRGRGRRARTASSQPGRRGHESRCRSCPRHRRLSPWRLHARFPRRHSPTPLRSARS